MALRDNRPPFGSLDSFYDRGVAQMVERLVWDQDAAGSNPVTPIMLTVEIGFSPISTVIFMPFRSLFV